MENNEYRIVYVAHPASGLARSNFPLECHVVNNEIIRCVSFRIPDNVRLYEIKTSRGVFTRPRKESQMALAYAWKQRIYQNRVKYPLLRKDWDPNDPKPKNRGKSEYIRITWDEAVDIIVNQIKEIHDTYSSMAPVLVLADGHGQSNYMQSVHFWGHVLFDKINEKLGWGWWTQQLRNPDSWEGYYWGGKHVWGFELGLGEPYQDAVWDDVLENTEMVIFSGCDPESTGIGMSGNIATITADWLKKAGIKIVAVSPDLNYGSAKYADKWIPIKPNTDAALYLALAYVWIKEDIYDKEYVSTHTVGFEEFKKHVVGEDDGIPKTPEWAEKITGIPAHTIKALAREWHSKKTSLCIFFGGPKNRGVMSHLPIRLEAYLLAMQGLGKPGRQLLRIGAPSMSRKWIPQFPRYPEVDREGIPLNPIIDYALGNGPKSKYFIPRTLVADAILNPPIRWHGTGAPFAKAEDQFKEYQFPPPGHPGIRMIWNENANQPVSWEYGSKWVKAMQDEKIKFIVSVHPWLENDVVFSDLILPAQTMFEHEDLISVQRSDLIALFYQERAIQPVGESKSDYEIVKLIAERLGIGAEFPPVEELLRDAYEGGPYTAQIFPALALTTLGKRYQGSFAFRKLGISWEEFKKRKFIIYDCPTWDEWIEIKRKEVGFDVHEGGLAYFWKSASGLETPTGKIEFVSQNILKYDPNDRERPPVAKWVEHKELQSSEKAKEYPFLVISNHPRLRFHSQGDDIDWIREIWKIKGSDGYLYEPCWINPDDAKVKGIGEGDIVMVFNDRGAVLCAAHLTERVIPGSIYIEHGAKMDLYIKDGLVIDRGGSINMISPSPAEKYKDQSAIKIPEMSVSGFLVNIKKVDDINSLLKGAAHITFNVNIEDKGE